jgi:hypothetical protein
VSLNFVESARAAAKPPKLTRSMHASAPPQIAMSASLIGHLGSSAFRLSATAVSMSLAGSCFSSESAPGPFHHGIRGRGGTIFAAALSWTNDRSKRTCELTSSIVPRGTSFHCWVDLGFPSIALIYVPFMLLRFPWSSGTQCRQPRCGA